MCKKLIICLLFLLSSMGLASTIVEITDLDGNPIDSETLQGRLLITFPGNDVEPPPIEPPPIEPPPIEPPPIEPPPIEPPEGLAAIVYSRVPSAAGIHTIDGYESWHTDVWDVLPDVFNQTNNFNGLGQLVYRDSEGAETVVEDCFTDNLPCLPTDPAVSLDGKKIVYAVLFSGELVNRKLSKQSLPVLVLRKQQNSETAVIKTWDIESGEVVSWPACTPAPCHDLSPIFLQDGKVMFMSNRDKQTRVNIRPGTNPSQYAFRPYIANADGTNPVPVGPHVMSGALHPILMNDGWIAIGEMWDFHNLAYHRSNGTPGGHDTRDNQWIVVKVNREYGDAQALLGAHHMDYEGFAYPLEIKNSRKTKALHFLGQRANGDLCTVNYYRRNNKGLGDIVCWPLQENLLEGNASNGFLPDGYYQLVKWANFGDQKSYEDAEGMLAGKIGWPEGTADNQIMVTLCRGLCTDNRYKLEDLEYMKEPFQYGARTGIYKTTVIPSEHPSDMEVVVDTLEWHEFNARVVTARAVPTPDLVKTSDGTCQLISTNAKATDSHSQNHPFVFNNQQIAMANDGSELYMIPQETVEGIRLIEVEQERQFRKLDGQVGPDYEKDKFVQTYQGYRSARVMGDITLQEDGSFKAQIPCDTPFTMNGIDKNGLIIKRDQVPMSLRKGEVRLCEGCHLHGERGRPYEESQASKVAPQVITKSLNRQIEWVKDVGPIVEAKCVECHDRDSPNGVFMNDHVTYNKLAVDNFQTLTEDHLKFDVNGWNDETDIKLYALERPYASKYINNMFAASSLFYWKAAGKRTDYNTDQDYADDIDFGAEHGRYVTDAELRKIQDWIETGAAYEAYNSDFTLSNPVLVDGPCDSWEQATLRQHEANCMFRFTMALEPGELEPSNKLTEWPINIVVPPASDQKVGVHLAYHGGSGTEPNTSMGTGGNFGIRPVDTRQQPGAVDCTGVPTMTTGYTGYGWFPDGRPAKKYVQRRIKAAIDWLVEKFPDQITFNAVVAEGRSMGHMGAVNFLLSDYNLQTRAEGIIGRSSMVEGSKPAWWAKEGGGGLDVPCGKGPGPNDNPGYNQEFIDSIDLRWWSENSDYYKFGWCNESGWGRTDALIPWESIKTAINTWSENRMCQKLYLSAGYFYTANGEKDSHSANDGCFTWAKISPKEMGFTLDHPALSFSNSTGDYPYTPPWGDEVGRGHVSLGFDWDSSGIVEESDTLTIPVRYSPVIFKTRSTYIMDETAETCKEIDGIQTVMPPMPEMVTADVMLVRKTREPSRHENFISMFWPEPGQAVKLTYGVYTDTAVADENGRVLYRNVPFSSGDYVDMVFAL